MTKNNKEVLTVGGGCFWCVEAVFNQIEGVEKVVSGYMGGTVPGTPTYREVCSGLTGHAEVIQVTYNPDIISFEELLIIFMTSHDPTTLNRQGADVGTQYRSVIFYHTDEQRAIAEKVIEELKPYFEETIVTEVSAASTFHAAEDYHQNYYENNKEQMYCAVVISPKLSKLRKMYANKLKSEN
ncbi:peptide-methionine (S)-S-oxide reductase MsrA [Tenacibaculum sp.]|uniref:peptide-methionine (S)-S-oxide reductase MsrA n=1 Tax=Tenacibaculum sp. TaxID=1906242 RepID=UPI003D0AB1A5